MEDSKCNLCDQSSYKRQRGGNQSFKLEESHSYKVVLAISHTALPHFWVVWSQECFVEVLSRCVIL